MDANADDILHVAGLRWKSLRFPMFVR